MLYTNCDRCGRPFDGCGCFRIVVDHAETKSANGPVRVDSGLILDVPKVVVCEQCFTTLKEVFEDSSVC